MVDLAHTLNVHTPGWVGYAGNQDVLRQTLQTNRIVDNASRAPSTPAPPRRSYAPADGGGDMASLSLDFLGNRGVIVGGDMEKVLNRRAIIGALPWKYEVWSPAHVGSSPSFDVGDLTVSEFAEAVADRSA